MSVHILTEEGEANKIKLQEIQDIIKKYFKITHTTIQIEEKDFKENQVSF